MQKLCNFEALYKPEIQLKYHKDSPQKENFFENTCFTRNIHKYRFKKKSVLKFPEFLFWKMLFAFLIKNLVNVGKKLVTLIYTSIKNILEVRIWSTFGS